MKKTLLSFLVCCFAMLSAVAQPEACLSYAGGPYSDQGIDVAACEEGGSVNAPYAAWLNEIYFTTVSAGGNYTFSICDGYDDAAWGGPAIITVIAGGTPTAGEVTGGTVVTTVEGCEVTFDATETGTVYFTLTIAGDCGGAVLNTDNGVPTVVTNVGVGCGVCGDGECTIDENYCTCPDDCTSCDGLINPTFIRWNPTGGTQGTGGFQGLSALNAEAMFCPLELETYVGTLGEEGSLYLGIGFFGNACFETNPLNISASTGTVLGFDLLSTETIEPASVFFLQVTQDDIDNSGGVTTLTYSNPDDSGCFVNLEVNWATLGAAATLVETECPPLNNECGANGCEPGENYCNCIDCDCADAVDPVYILIDTEGNAVGDPNLTIASAFCSFQMAEAWGITNAEDGMLYLAVGYFGNTCGLAVTSTEGTVVDLSLAPVETVASAAINFLAVSQDDIIASNGFTTLTYTNPDIDNCNLDVVIDWNLIAPFADILSMVCPAGTCGANGCEVSENYCNCSTDCTCGALLDPVSVDFSGTDPVGSVANTTSALFCASDLGLEEGFVYYAVTYFGASCLDGATFNLSATDNATFVGFDDDNNPLDITDLGTTAIAFVKVSLQDANGITTVTFTNPDDSNCSTSYNINWDELLVCDNAIQPSFISFDEVGSSFVSNDVLNVSNVFCADELDALSIAGADPNYVYIGLGYFNLTCNTPSVSVSTEDGSIVALNADGTALEDATEVSSASVNFLKINPAQIAGAGASTTLTYTQGACSKTQTITWSSISTTANACIVAVPQVVASGFGISRIAPVPSNNQVQISYDMPKATTVHAQVFDMVGRAVYTQNIAANNGKNNLNLNIANFATGVYYIVLNDGTNNVMGKIVKQ